MQVPIVPGCTLLPPCMHSFHACMPSLALRLAKKPSGQSMCGSLRTRPGLWQPAPLTAECRWPTRSPRNSIRPYARPAGTEISRSHRAGQTPRERFESTVGHFWVARAAVASTVFLRATARSFPFILISSLAQKAQHVWPPGTARAVRQLLCSDPGHSVLTFSWNSHSRILGRVTGRQRRR